MNKDWVSLAETVRLWSRSWSSCFIQLFGSILLAFCFALHPHLHTSVSFPENGASHAKPSANFTSLPAY